METIKKIMGVMASLLSERSTWQGIGFFLGAFVSKDLAGLDWGAAAFIGASLSALLKLLPDKKDV